MADLPPDPFPGEPQGTWIDVNRANLGTLGLAVQAIGSNIVEAADSDLADVRVFAYALEQFLVLQRCVDQNAPALIQATEHFLRREREQ